MADTKTSALTAIPELAGADVLPIVDATDTTTKKVSITQLDGRYATAAQGTTADGAIPKSLVDAKGDLLVATANDTPARLAVGVTNGHVLTVDSAEATGVKWAAAGGVNLLEPRTSFYPIAGERYTTGTYQGTGTTTATSQQIKYSPFSATMDCTIDTLRCEVTGLIAGETFSLAIYDSLNGNPNALLDSVTGLVAGSTGHKTGTFGTPVSITAGAIYWVAHLWVTAGGASPTFRGVSQPMSARFTEVPDNVARNLCLVESGSHTAFPSTSTGIAAYNSGNRVMPFVYLSVGSVS